MTLFDNDCTTHLFLKLPASLTLSSIETMRTLQCKLRPIQIAEFSKEIYLICPVMSEQHQLHSLLFYEDRVVLSWQNPKEVVTRWLQDAHYLRYTWYYQSMYQLLQYRYKKMPCATSGYCLFPTESSENVETTQWINARRVTQLSSIAKSFFSTIITLDNGIQLYSELEQRTLKKMMLRSFQCHAIIRQEFACHGCINDCPSLLQTLSIPSNQLTSQLCRTLEEQFPMPKRGAFFNAYKHTVLHHHKNN